MSINVLATGTLHKDPVQRTSQTGKAFTTASLRIDADGSATWASVIAFSEDAQSELLKLKAGDSVSIQGRLKVGLYSKDGADPRPSLDITASTVVGLKPKPRVRQTRRPPPDYAAGRQFDPRRAYARPTAPDPDFDDEIPI